MKTFIDSTVFMGMHSSNEETRVAAKNFFIEHFDKTLYMTYEDVGECDDIVWQYTREEQDAYYPFMDRLHTVMDIQRIPYSAEAIANSEVIGDLSTKEQLLLSSVRQAGGVLYTLNEALLALNEDSIVAPAGDASNDERFFADDLESFYQESLTLRT